MLIDVTACEVMENEKQGRVSLARVKDCKMVFACNVKSARKVMEKQQTTRVCQPSSGAGL